MDRSLFAPLAIAVLSFTAATPLRAQEAFESGDNLVGIGLGFGGVYNAYNAYSSVSPVFTAHFEHGMPFNAGPGVVGIGAFVGFKTVSYTYDIPGFGGPRYYYDYRWNYLQFGARGAYHWNEWHGVDQLDTYAGVLVGAFIVTESDNSNYPYAGYGTRGTSGGGLRTDLFAGARWYFTEGFGVYGELGYGLSNIALGVNFKF